MKEFFDLIEPLLHPFKKAVKSRLKTHNSDFDGPQKKDIQDHVRENRESRDPCQEAEPDVRHRFHSFV
jgi:hypothetical protein